MMAALLILNELLIAILGSFYKIKMENQLKIIKEKIDKEMSLTDNETLIYLTEIQKLTPEQAAIIINKEYEDVKESD